MNHLPLRWESTVYVDAQLKCTAFCPISQPATILISPACFCSLTGAFVVEQSEFFLDLTERSS